MSDDDLAALRNVLTCAILTVKARHILSEGTLDAVYAELEKWAKDNGHWTKPKLAKEPKQ